MVPTSKIRKYIKNPSPCAEIGICQKNNIIWLFIASQNHTSIWIFDNVFVNPFLCHNKRTKFISTANGAFTNIILMENIFDKNINEDSNPQTHYPNISPVLKQLTLYVMYQGAARNGIRPERPKVKAGAGAFLRPRRSSKMVSLFVPDEKWALASIKAVAFGGTFRPRIKLLRHKIDNIADVSWKWKLGNLSAALSSYNNIFNK